MEKQILVIYVGVGGIDYININEYTKKVAEKITPSTFEGEIIIIPTSGIDTRIECINPIYVTKKRLIKEHKKLIKNLQIELKNRLEDLRTENNNTINNS